MTMRIVVGAEEARRTVLFRPPASEIVLGEAGKARVADIFGEPLSASEAVSRIIADVRRDGDTAVRRYSEVTDGVSYPDLEVPRREIDAALGTLEPQLRQ